MLDTNFLLSLLFDGLLIRKLLTYFCSKKIKNQLSIFLNVMTFFLTSISIIYNFELNTCFQHESKNILYIKAYKVKIDCTVIMPLKYFWRIPYTAMRYNLNEY